MHKRLPVHNYPNLFIYTHRANKFYWRQQINFVNYEKCTKVVAEFKEIELDGKVYAEPLKNVKLAAQIADKFRMQVLTEGCIKRNNHFSQLFDLALEIQKQKSNRTFIIAKDSDKHLRPFWEKEIVQNFDQDCQTLWARYVEHEKEKSDRKLMHDLKYLVFCLRLAYQKGWVKRLYSRSEFKLPDVQLRVGKYLDDETIKIILDEILAIGDKKFYVKVLMALYMGMRKSEILGLPLDEIDLHKKEITINPQRTKTRKGRRASVPIPDAVYSHLLPFIEESKNNKGIYVFPKAKWQHIDENGDTIGEYDYHSPQLEFPKYWRQSGRMRKDLNIITRFHDLRHTCITNMIMQNVPLSTISSFLGADIKILNEIYYQVNDEAKEKIRNIFNGRFIK